MLGRLAARQHGVVHIEQLRRLGMTRQDIEYRVRIGRLYPLHRGVYAVGRPGIGDDGHFIAAVFAIGDDAGLSHAPSAVAWGFTRRWPGPVDVTVPRRVAQRRGIRVHVVRDLDPSEVTTRRGIPITTPARTLIDLASVLPRRQLRRAVNEALVQRKVTLPLLVRQLERAKGRNGTANLRAVLADAAPTRSELEDMTREFLARHGYARPESNVEIAGFEVDFLLPGGLVIETDGGQFHDNPLARADDARKQAALEAAGHPVIRLRWKDVVGAGRPLRLPPAPPPGGRGPSLRPSR